MPARRRAPMGYGPQARWLRRSRLTYHTGYARRSCLASGPGGRSKVQTLFIDRPLLAALMWAVFSVADSESRGGSVGLGCVVRALKRCSDGYP